MSQKQSCSKPGFTLVELLVVIAIIGILVALLLPAVQSARESARRMECKNHLKQLGLASLTHEEKYGFFPSNGWGFKWVGDPDRGTGRTQPGGWAYHLLPFLEEDTVYTIGVGMQGHGPGGDKYNALAEQKASVVGEFHCPSRRIAKLYRGFQTSHNAAQPERVAKTDYVVNGGTGPMMGVEGPGASCLDNYPNCSWNFSDNFVQRVFTGMATIRSEVLMADIVDGSSNTILVGEKYLNPKKYETGSCTDDNALYQGNDWDVVRWVPEVDATGNVINPTARRPVRDTPGLYDCTQRFGSAHPSVFHVVMCDGSVHGLSYDIDLKTFSFLGNRRDGKVISSWP